MNILVPFCAGAACLNEGVCDPIVSTCTCPSGFNGPRCEIIQSKINFKE